MSIIAATHGAGWARQWTGTGRQIEGSTMAIVVTTTPEVAGREVEAYLGIVTAEAILGANVVKDLFAGVRDIVGGRSGAYEKELKRARAIALQELEQNAAELGANAVVGVDLDYETVGGGSMLMVTASGTAVRLR